MIGDGDFALGMVMVIKMAVDMKMAMKMTILRDIGYVICFLFCFIFLTLIGCTITGNGQGELGRVLSPPGED